MQRTSFRLTLVFVGLVLLFSIFFFVLKKDAKSQAIIPGKFPLKDQNSAIASGRRIAEVELDTGFKPENMKLVSVETKSPATLMDEAKSNGEILAKNAFPTKSDVWVVTFSGSFTSKRRPPMGDKRIYSSMVIYLLAEDGSVFGVDMYGGVKENIANP